LGDKNVKQPTSKLLIIIIYSMMYLLQYTLVELSCEFVVMLPYYNTMNNNVIRLYSLDRSNMPIRNSLEWKWSAKIKLYEKRVVSEYFAETWINDDRVIYSC